MFRQEKIGEVFPLSAGVGEGNRRRKIFLSIIIFSVVFVLLVCPFSVSAMTSGNATLTVYDSFIICNGKYQGYYGSSNTDTSIQCNFIGMDTPSDGYLDAGVYLDFNSSQRNGLLQFAMYLAPETVGTGPADELSTFKNFSGLYDSLSGKKLSNASVSGNKVVFQYKGTIPNKLLIRTQFSCQRADGFMNAIMVVDFVFTPNDELSALENDNANTDKIIDNQDQNTEEIKQSIAQQSQLEKQEAQSSGNSAMDSVSSVVPNYSNSLLSAFSNLTKNMVHDKVQCVLTIPAIKTPKLTIESLGIVLEEVTLMNSKTINLFDYLKLIPTNILNIVRIVLTSVLIIYAFKEFYGIFELIFTLKGSAN